MNVSLERHVMQVTRQVAHAPDYSAERESWHDDALCNEYPADLWFPEKGSHSDEAKLICTGCPVKDECLAFALENGERFGIWGGLTETERRTLARQRGLRRSTSRRDGRPRVHLCQERGCSWAGPTRDSLSAHRQRAHRTAGAA